MRDVLFLATLLSATLLAPTDFCAAQVKLKNASNSRPTASWRPYASIEPLEEELDFIDALLDRELNDLAAEQLDSIAVETLENASARVKASYASAAIRVALETAKLASPAGREKCETRLKEIRERVPNESLDSTASIDYELDYIRAFYWLGILATESAQGKDANEGTRYFSTALDASRVAVGALPTSQARPFLYWHAKTLLADTTDSKRFSKVEKFADALERSSRKEQDEYYFYARLLAIETARESGDVQTATQRVKETLDALDALDKNDANAPFETALGLVVEEAKLLLVEGDYAGSLKTIVQDVDLLDAPLPVNRGRFVERLPDLFVERDWARVAICWAQAPNAPKEEEEGAISNIPTQKALVEAARIASSKLRSNVMRTRASLLAQETGSTVDDRTAIEASAQELYRAGEYAKSVAEYDRAAASAENAGASADARRLRSTAAGVVNKICADKAFEGADKTEKEWNEDASARFVALAKEELEDKLAPSFFLLAIQRAEVAQEQKIDYALRLEYLALFPNAEGRAEFALELARLALAENDRRAALDALASVDPADKRFPDALELERRVYRARRADDEEDASALYVETLDRALDRTSFASKGRSADAEALGKRLAQSANELGAQTPTDSDKALLAFIMEISLESDQRRLESIAQGLDAILARWEETTRENDEKELARVRTFRLSLAADAQSPATLAAMMSDLDGLAPDVAIDALEKIVDYAEEIEGATQEELARFVSDALQKLDASDKRANTLQADAKRMLGRAQEALNLYAAEYKKAPNDPRVVRGIAALLSARSDSKTLERALKYWTDLADLFPVASSEWWNAKEECIRVYVRLGKKEQAEKMLKTLWLTRSDPNDPTRKARWERMIREGK